ncbi:glycosyltransferase [Opitutales bacterium]|nr:glycosyltransferase [Opitutales bacterium]
MNKINENWLERNTFHHADFWDLIKLVEEKEKKGLKISLCIPTLNEEKTIGKEVLILRSELMERYPLIDEFAVIDSGSKDKTLEVAKNYGADVYLASDILPEVGDKRGKGENLWKAIHQLKGDIICYVDADISNIHPRFVYGLVAPLIHRDEISYVKAFYDRPLNYSSGLRPSGGGQSYRDSHPSAFLTLFPRTFPHHPTPIRGICSPSRSTRKNSFSDWIRSGNLPPFRPLCDAWVGDFCPDRSRP